MPSVCCTSVQLRWKGASIPSRCACTRPEWVEGEVGSFLSLELVQLLQVEEWTPVGGHSDAQGDGELEFDDLLVDEEMLLLPGGEGKGC